MKIYVASSWRNPYFDLVVDALKDFHIYNFKEDSGFQWTKVLGNDWQDSSIGDFNRGLQHPAAEIGYIKDITALEAASATVLVLPCGRSAHWELGYAAGRKQFTAIYSVEQFEPELMYKSANLITDDINELVNALDDYQTSIWNKKCS